MRIVFDYVVVFFLLVVIAKFAENDLVFTTLPSARKSRNFELKMQIFLALTMMTMFTPTYLIAQIN
jgi:hypothetical protein